MEHPREWNGNERRGLSRRRLLRCGLAAVGAAGGLPPPGRAEPATRPALPRPCPPTAWRKRGVLLEPTESWEAGNIQNFTCPAEPLGGRRWRFWYSVSGGRGSYTLAYAEGVPGEPMRKVPVRCSPGRPADGPFSLGNLPDGWRPVQVIRVRLRDGRHRIYFWAHGPEVARYLAADSDDGRRYRVIDPYRPVLYHPSDRAARGVPSPDGVLLHKEPANRPADEPAAPPHLISNDATNLYLLPDGTFEMYSVALVPVPKDSPAYVPEDNAPGLIRVIDRYTSGDGLRFENRTRVVQPDTKDPADQQFYYLAVTHTPRGRVGMLGHYPCRAQTMDIEWCFSGDGLAWRRPLRSAWLACGEPGQPDSYGMYACNRLVLHGGQWHLFYTGVNSAHNGRHSHGPPRSVILHATTDSIWASG